MLEVELGRGETMQELADAELDAVSAGQASAALYIYGIGASGPNSAEVAVYDLNVSALTVGGASPSNTAVVSGNFFASSS